MKPKTCPCGIRFKPSRQFQKYHSPICELSFKTGKVNPEDYSNLPLQVLRDIAIGAFQDYVKLRDKDKGCYTCPSTKGVFHAGHAFKKELFTGMIFNEIACQKQCGWCNIGLDGNVPVFMEKLQKELGIEAFIKLENEAITTKSYRWTKLDFIEIAEYFKSKIKEIEARNNVGAPVYDLKIKT